MEAYRIFVSDIDDNVNMKESKYNLNLLKFAERLSDLMFETNLNAHKFAKILNCGRATINRYTSGYKMPSVDMVIKIADYFNCSTDYLMGLDDEDYPQTYNKCPAFKDRLPNLLKHFNISRYKLQKLSNISESTLYYWSKGQTIPTIDKLITIANALDCSLDFVLGRTKS